jgi:hypothetical protein
MYDLDKTQEWLNRTIQMSKGPAVRGGVSGEPHARKHTAASVLAAFAVILAGMLLMSWTRGAGDGTGSTVVAVEARRRVAAAPSSSPPTVTGVASPPGNRPRQPVNRVPAGWPALSLDGDVTPLPGHTAPPAPVWLDGPLFRR